MRVPCALHTRKSCSPVIANRNTNSSPKGYPLFKLHLRAMSLSQHSRSMTRPPIVTWDSITGLDLTRTNAVCGVTTLPSVGTLCVILVHNFRYLPNTAVGQLRWLTFDGMRQPSNNLRRTFTVGLSLTQFSLVLILPLPQCFCPHACGTPVSR